MIHANEEETQADIHSANGTANGVVSIADGHAEHDGKTTGYSAPMFPLLDGYLETASSKVWKDITDNVLAGIEKRKSDIEEALRSTTSDGNGV